MSMTTTSGRSAFARSDRLAAVSGLADNLDPAVGEQEGAQALPDDRVIVG
jgi:hypothetical protein